MDSFPCLLHPCSNYRLVSDVFWPDLRGRSLYLRIGDKILEDRRYCDQSFTLVRFLWLETDSLSLKEQIWTSGSPGLVAPG